jgi:membrane associated rhomboid family serine protease
LKNSRRVYERCCACRYTPVHVYLLVLVLLAAFAYQAGAYPYWLQHTPRDVDRPATAPPFGPAGLAAWISRSGVAWRSFSPYYLVRWGARYSAMAGEGWRWFTSVLLHANTLHITSNLFMFCALGGYIEAKFGTWRTAGARLTVLLPVISCTCSDVLSSVASTYCQPAPTVTASVHAPLQHSNALM